MIILFKKIAGDSGDTDLIPGMGTSPGEGNSNPLQYPFFFSFFHSSILPWEIPRTEEPGRLLSKGSQSLAQLSN